MIMDTLGALSLATESPCDDLMKRPPVCRKGKFIRNILGQSLYQLVILWYLQTNGKAVFHLEDSDADLILNTLILNSFFCQGYGEAKRVRKHAKNCMSTAVLACTVVFRIVIIQFLGTFANTYPVSLQQWVVTVLLGFLGMPVVALLKMIPVGSG